MSSTSTLKQLNQWKSAGGYVRKFVHLSEATKTEMKFSVFIPPQAQHSKVPALYWLSGLTCTDDNFIQKAGAFKAASARGIALVCPDTSPRGANIAGETDSWDFGAGAGFYVNAQQEPWANNYNMYQYVTQELPKLIEANLPINDKRAIAGHSMGGHGALICFLKNAGMYSSVSAFAPICAPSDCPWGVKAFTGYLGSDKEQWKLWDARHLLSNYSGSNSVPILIDQGSEDDFLHQKQLLPELFIEAAKQRNIPVDYRLQPGYDHSYFFISTFIDEHIDFHAKALGL